MRATKHEFNTQSYGLVLAHIHEIITFSGLLSVLSDPRIYKNLFNRKVSFQPRTGKKRKNMKSYN